ncbi:MAG: ABC transporter ATP-binding protein [Oscillospiraceae bacterium]|nr:ABC transporter ATP-binding protein [Oscillospiraceae bacterium]
MADEKRMSLSEAARLQWRAIREIHRLDPQYLPSRVCAKIAAAVTPYALIWFSAQLLNELSGARRVDALRHWAALAVAAGGLLALLNALLARWTSVHETIYWDRYRTLYIDKQFSMDFADVDKQSTRDLKAQIQQSENWAGWGFGHVSRVLAETVGGVAGILGASALTAGLFLAKVPAGAGKMQIMNSPLFILAQLGLMVLVSVLSGRLDGYVDALEAGMVDKARSGNRFFTYFCSFGRGRGTLDVRMYDQSRLLERFFVSSMDQGFGVNGPFAKLARGRGGVCRGFAGGLSAVFTGSIYAFTCLKALAGAFGVGSVTQYVGAATAFSQHLTALFSALSEMRTNGKFLARCYEYLDIPNAMYQGSLTTEKRNDREYNVEFRDVSFRYPGTDTWALRHVNVKFKVGSRMAIVGENGSGKTTFIKLLCRLYDPQEGEILLNGINIKKYNYRDYMDVFSVVFQDFQLLSQPLGDNVAGSRKYDEARAAKALCDAGFAERLETMPNGLRTMLYRGYDDTGVEVSGGEAQKIAIARALYRDAPFLILDEPTAALDPIAEAEIYAQLNQIVGDRTAIYISHRLSSCRFCDEIMVFDHGQIIQTGSHDELARREDGKYYALWHAQAQYYAKK